MASPTAGPFWEYRLGSIGIIIVAVVVAMIAFSASILLSGAQQFLVDWIPGAADIVGLLTLLQVAPALVLFGSLYLLFYILTPKRYRGTRLPQMAGRGLRRALVGGDDGLAAGAAVEPRRLRHHLWQPRRRHDRA